MLTEEEKNELIKIAQEKYPIGCVIDQTTAYNGSGGNRMMIDKSKVASYVNHTPYYFNVAIGGCGVYCTTYGIWAEIISYPEGYIKPVNNTYEIY